MCRDCPHLASCWRGLGSLPMNPLGSLTNAGSQGMVFHRMRVPSLTAQPIFRCSFASLTDPAIKVAHLLCGWLGHAVGSIASTASRVVRRSGAGLSTSSA
jgi:hypothetical protein